jgi:hypothetical protein
LSCWENAPDEAVGGSQDQVVQDFSQQEVVRVQCNLNSSLLDEILTSHYFLKPLCASFIKHSIKASSD